MWALTDLKLAKLASSVLTWWCKAEPTKYYDLPGVSAGSSTDPVKRLFTSAQQLLLLGFLVTDMEEE